MYIELWKTVPGYEGYFQVSTHGRVKSLDRVVIYKSGRKRHVKSKILKQQTDRAGYKFVELNKDGKGKIYKVHRLVALAFLENPNNLPEVNHKDEDKSNNFFKNLEWITCKNNCNYGTRNKKISDTKRSKKHYKSKPVLMFTLDDVFIRRFKSIAEANEYLGKNRGNSNIAFCIRGLYKTAHGYKWKLDED